MGLDVVFYFMQLVSNYLGLTISFIYWEQRSVLEVNKLMYLHFNWLEKIGINLHEYVIHFPIKLILTIFFFLLN